MPSLVTDVSGSEQDTLAEAMTQKSSADHEVIDSDTCACGQITDDVPGDRK